MCRGKEHENTKNWRNAAGIVARSDDYGTDGECAGKLSIQSVG